MKADMIVLADLCDDIDPATNKSHIYVTRPIDPRQLSITEGEEE